MEDKNFHTHTYHCFYLLIFRENSGNVKFAGYENE